MSWASWDAVGFLRHPLGASTCDAGPLGYPCPFGAVAGLQAGCPGASRMALHAFRQLHWAPRQYSQKSFWINSLYSKVDIKGGKQLLWHLMLFQRVGETHASLQIWHRPYRRPVPFLKCCLEVRWDMMGNVKWSWAPAFGQLNHPPGSTGWIHQFSIDNKRTLDTQPVQTPPRGQWKLGMLISDWTSSFPSEVKQTGHAQKLPRPTGCAAVSHQLLLLRLPFLAGNYVCPCTSTGMLVEAKNLQGSCEQKRGCC